MRRMLLLATVAVLATLTACGDPAPAPKPACAEQKAADEAAVRTTRWDPPAQLAALGEYVEIHWQARALAAQPGWQPATPEIWPALDEFAPPAADWQRADGDQAPTIYLDAASAVALFAITTS